MLHKSFPCKITNSLKFFKKIVYFRLVFVSKKCLPKLVDMRFSDCLISHPLLSKRDQHSSNSTACAISDNFGFFGFWIILHII